MIFFKDFNVFHFHKTLFDYCIQIKQSRLLNVQITLERVFHHISKHFEVRQKYSAACRISTLFSMFGNMIKHCPLYLVYNLREPQKISPRGRLCARLYSVSLLSGRLICGLFTRWLFIRGKRSNGGARLLLGENKVVTITRLLL